MKQVISGVLSSATFACGWTIVKLPLGPCAPGSGYSSVEKTFPVFPACIALKHSNTTKSKLSIKVIKQS